jgi:hypothetical protein
MIGALAGPLQALTRVNRPYKDFKYGYVVDFANIKQNFEDTNNEYLRELNRCDDNNETDDDNAPLANWTLRNEMVGDVRVVRENGWTNVYKYFTSQNIWPRGLLLDEIHAVRPVEETQQKLEAPVQQGLVNLSPDVDAIWRLA